MIEFILNNELIKTEQPSGINLLDFIRNNQQLKGSKLVCKEGECGACTILVGALNGDVVEYQSMTSCIMPLINAHGKHIVTIEGLNMEVLTPVQQAMVDSYGTQCGFCTPGFVVSLTGELLNKTLNNKDNLIGSIDGNICRCTGYKSIERAITKISNDIKKEMLGDISELIKKKYIPGYFSNISKRLADIASLDDTQQMRPKSGSKPILGGGTDLYVQRPYDMYETEGRPVYDKKELKKIEINNDICEIGASVTMGDLYRSDVFATALADCDYIFKLLSSTQIRNMSTIGGNLVNASPIGDFSILLLALDSVVTLEENGHKRDIALNKFFHGYKKMDLRTNEILTRISFKVLRPSEKFHFEKVSQRQYFDIASVNLASRVNMDEGKIVAAHLAIGGVGPIPMYLFGVSALLKNRLLNEALIDEAVSVLDEEISPISDARGSAQYKRLLARQLLIAQFYNADEAIYNIEKLIPHA